MCFSILEIRSNSLNETVAFGTTRDDLIALQDDGFKLAKWLEDLLKIGFGDAEVNVTNVKTVEGCAIGARSSAALGRSSSAVLLCFCELRNDWNTLEFLAGQFESFRDRLFFFELNISNTTESVSTLGTIGEGEHTLWNVR